MIKNVYVAEKISDLMLEFGSRIDESISFVKEHCNESEFHEYRKAAGKVMGEMLLTIMNPIYKEHPNLRPDKLQ